MFSLLKRWPIVHSLHTPPRIKTVYQWISKLIKYLTPCWIAFHITKTVCKKKHEHFHFNYQLTSFIGVRTTITKYISWLLIPKLAGYLSFAIPTWRVCIDGILALKSWWIKHNIVQLTLVFKWINMKTNKCIVTFVTVFCEVRVTLSLVLCVCFVRVTLSLVLCVCFVDRCPFVLFFFLPLCCLFFVDIQILITSLWYLQTLLILYNTVDNTSGAP